MPLIMNSNFSNLSRKKFILWSSSFLALIVIYKSKLFKSKDPEPKKYLTEDGLLVSVDSRHIGKKGKKIYTTDIPNWIKRN